MKKNLIVLQDGYKECGASSLLSIIRYYGGNISINKLVNLTKTDKFGTNLYNIKQASETLGLEAIGYKVGDISSLKQVRKPFICQIVEKNYEHFIVVYKVKNNKLEIMDPTCGKKELTIKEFSNIWTNYIMIFNPIKKLINYKEDKYINKLIIETIQKNKGIIFNILMLSIIFTIISFIYTFYIQIALEINNYNNLLILTFIFSLLLIIKSITIFTRNIILIYLNQKIDYTYIINTFQKILLLPFNYYKNRTTGEIISRINDLIYIKNILNKIILTVFLDLILFIGSGIILIKINHRVFIILILISLIYILILHIFKPNLKKYTNINQENQSQINSFLTETISGYETIKNLNLESIIKERMEDIYVTALNDNFIYENISNLELFLKELINLIGILLIEFIGFKQVLDGQIKVGLVITYSFLSNYFLTSIKNIIDISKEYYYATNTITRINNLFEIEAENLKLDTNLIINGNIKFNNLNFSYNGEKNILKKINLDIKQGEKIMILGSSGSGKSTILKLLLKYYKTNRNNIYIDDIDINDYSIKNIRDNICCMTGNDIIYTDTIKNNITMYQNIEEEIFRKVCKLTKVDEFTNLLFLGYNTKLEENGVNLSGGQRQRILLARMLLQNKKIILIDEGLNAVDIELERSILKNIFNEYKNNTIIIVSHRLENIDLFDKVIKIDKGINIETINKLKEDIII